MFYFETCRILIHLHSKSKVTLSNVSNSKPRVCDARKDAMTQKTSKTRLRPPARCWQLAYFLCQIFEKRFLEPL